MHLVIGSSVNAAFVDEDGDLLGTMICSGQLPHVGATVLLPGATEGDAAISVKVEKLDWDYATGSSVRLGSFWPKVRLTCRRV